MRNLKFLSLQRKSPSHFQPPRSWLPSPLPLPVLVSETANHIHTGHSHFLTFSAASAFSLAPAAALASARAFASDAWGRRSVCVPEEREKGQGGSERRLEPSSSPRTPGAGGVRVCVCGWVSERRLEPSRSPQTRGCITESIGERACRFKQRGLNREA